MTEPLLQLNHLAVDIAGRRALHDVTLEVARGSSLGVVGETGSGKSLTCRAVLGMLDGIGGKVVGGSARFGETDLLQLRPHQLRALRRHDIGFVPQGSLVSLDPVLKIGTQLAEAVRNVGDSANVKKRCRELLDAVEMHDVERVLSSHPHELSGGMRQRVMIALALAGSPQLLVADEATTALDVTIQRAILELLDRLRRDLNMALLLVTHDLSVVRAHCDEVVVMYAGATVERGSSDDVCSRPAHPYTQALIAAQPSLTGPREPLVGLPGAPPEIGEARQGCAFAPRCHNATDVCRAQNPALRDIDARRAAACLLLEKVDP